MRTLLLSLALFCSAAIAQAPPPPGTVAVDPGVAVRPACDTTISSNTDWSAANNTAYRVICVAPGVANTGTVTLSASGTQAAPRWLRLNRSDNAHAANITQGETAATAVLNVTGNWWIIDRISVRNGSSASTIAGTNNTFQFGVFDTRIGSGNGQMMYLQGSNNSVVASVFRNPLRSSGYDSYAVYIGGGAGTGTGNKVVGNEFIAMPNGIQIAAPHGGGHLILGNEFYQTSASNANCSGALSPAGLCMCGEGTAFVAKASSTPITYVEGNFVWDYSKTDPSCAGSGSPGDMLNLGSGNFTTQNYVLRNNTLVGRVGANRVEAAIYNGANVSLATITQNYIANVKGGIAAIYIDNSTLTDNIYSNNTTNFSTSGSATGNTISPANAGRAAVTGERCVVKFHLTNPTPVCYP